MKLEKSRFHIHYGPSSLFDRVRFKMKDVEVLKMHSNHFKTRVEERRIQKNILDDIKNFSISEWNLVTVEVRNDKGKFINSTWEKNIKGLRYWITIGFNDTIQTIVIKDSNGTDKCITCGELYDYVEEVNKNLMKSENY